MIIVAIDPGLRHCGVAAGEEAGSLQSAFLAINTFRPPLRGEVVWRAMADVVVNRLEHLGLKTAECGLVLEYPKTYRGASVLNHVSPEDIQELRGVCDEIWKLKWKRRHKYYPRDWKGTVPKTIMNNRVLGLLSAAEKSEIQDAGHLTHNILDSIGIFLKYGKRL